MLILEEFLCRMYGSKQMKLTNAMRSALFSKTYNFMDKDELFHVNAKNFDASVLPPCQSELRQHFLRTAYIANVWKNAHLQYPTTMSPTEYGWQEGDGMYSFKWLESDQLPEKVDDIVLQEDRSNDAIENPDDSPENVERQEDIDFDHNVSEESSDDDDDDDDINDIEDLSQCSTALYENSSDDND
ncbi:uncharacterized transcriptional regulatory protein TBS1-like [Nasonia vitripennis]|uniref:Uncharacterized protein n=1 Tax=Nasonia vitripennis TaxID=7425 RepID=A0A7M7QBC8_NASVI|nr:uncharacterized transcriptional regulatory protein TBS1-like [Nasonia vitripennis]